MADGNQLYSNLIIWKDRKLFFCFFFISVKYSIKGIIMLIDMKESKWKKIELPHITTLLCDLTKVQLIF